LADSSRVAREVGKKKKVKKLPKKGEEEKSFTLQKED